MRMLDLFAGICGVSLAAEWAGIDTVAFCEIEPFPQKVIRKHWPGVPIFEDVRKLNRQMLLDKGVIDDAGTRTIDIICAGYPCQPFSNAGQRRGEEDDRHLWPEVARLIGEIRPRWFVGENVAGHITLGLDNVLADLGGLSYSCETFVIPAAAIGAPHRRDRVFIVGYTEYDGHVTTAVRGSSDKTSNHDKKGQNEAGESPGASGSGDDEALGNTKRLGCDRKSWRRTRPQLKNGYMGGKARIMAYTTSEGFPQRRQSRFAETGTQAGAGLESEPERCSQDVANSNEQYEHDGGFGASPIFRERPAKTELSRSQEVMADSPGERCGETRRFRSGEPKERIASSGENVADSKCFRQQGSWESIEPGNPAPNQNGETSGTLNDGIGTKRSIESRLGGMLNGLSDRLDECRWPAGLGQPQHDWEPPRVASGVKNRVGRLKGLGNAVSPQQIYPVLYFIKQINDSLELTI